MTAVIPTAHWYDRPSARVRRRFSRWREYDRVRQHLSREVAETNVCKRLETLARSRIARRHLRAWSNVTGKRNPPPLVQVAIERLTASWSEGPIRREEWIP